MTRSKQTTDGVEYGGGSDSTRWMTYTYNLSGALIEQQYPSGRVVRNTLDVDGDLQQVESRRANDTFRNYANSFTYNAAGAVASMKLGNGKFENTQFNSRLQPVQIGLGSSASTQNLLKLNFDYGTTDNNGNVKSQQIAVPAIGGAAAYTATQVYTYDSLNRIKQATETIPAQTGWQQTFVYDRYGNRRFDAANTTTLAPGCAEAVCNPQIDPATNKLIGYQFDDAGNTKTDASGQTYIYDSENKQVQVNNAGGTVGQYFYNGDGQRVKKVVPSTGETTIFVYDAASKLVAEYSTQVEPAATAKISYLTNDHLGSPRITTAALGQVVSRRDFRPFGEEIARAGYGADSVRQKFTSYERDNEIDLEFAQARYYQSGYGRFTSADPLLTSASVSNPQTWNRFKYALNNPLLFVDPLGLYEWGESAGGDAEDGDLLARSEDKSLSKKERRAARRQYDFRQRFTAALKKAKEAANNPSLTPSQRRDAQRAVNSYGALNDGTHDNVKVGVWGNNGASPETDLRDDGNIYVNFNGPEALDDAENFVVSVAHEGSHSADFQDWAANPDLGNDITQYETERRAYLVGSYTAQAIGMNSYNSNFENDERTWKKGWDEQKRDTERSNSVERFITNRAGPAPNGQPLTKTNPGWNMGNRGLLR